jgi:nucleoside-diphosphate-sugar epimerase
MSNRSMKIFVAGATGATGSVFVPRALAAGHDVLFHVRPRSVQRSPLASDQRARILELTDINALTRALQGCEVIVSFVGTDRRRFDAGDTYQASDIASTLQLCAAAAMARVPRLLLQSSIGAGGVGAYLQTKAKCESIVKDSGLRWTIWRPSGLVSPEAGPEGTHGRRRLPSHLSAVFRLLRLVPGLSGFADDFRPIPIEVVCDAVLHLMVEPLDAATLTGRQLWALGQRFDQGRRAT